MTLPLVIGYGNGLCSDDGVGLRVAERLAKRCRKADTLTAQQLVLELALKISFRQHVVFVDAALGKPEGQVVVTPLRPSASVGPSTHHLNPSALLGVCSILYGASPDAYLVSVNAKSLKAGQRLTRVVQAAVPKAVAAVERLLGTFHA